MRFFARALSVVLAVGSIACSFAADASAPKFELAGMDGIIEGIAYRAKTDEYFFGDVDNRCVWRRDRSGHVAKFSAGNPALFGVFGLTVDEKHHRLWAATSMIPGVTGFTPADKGHAALVAIDLLSGRVLDAYPAPLDGKDHVFGDLFLAPDGIVYVTDSAAPVIWKLANRGTRLEALTESPQFHSLQGVGLLSDRRTLVVTDYAHGLFAVDRSMGAIRPIPAPEGADVRGLDGLVVEGDHVIAVQNGSDPNTVVRLTLAPEARAITKVETVSVPADGFTDLTLLARGPSGLCVIANSGWALANPAKCPTVPTHTVRVFELETQSTR
jgi:sugar lactone lactonase YvrE